MSPTLHKSIVLQATLNKRQVIVTALSPMPSAFAQFLAHVGSYLPRNGQPINHAPEVRPNLAAVALHIDLGDDAVLLGADLEEHHTYGWSAVVADRWSGARRPATAFKIAHHGSHTGDCTQVWARMLKSTPTACLTPFTLGNLRLPTDADKARVKGNTALPYTSSAASRRPEMDSRLLKRLGDICKNVARVDSGFGAVRLRRQVDTAAWGVELFGSAQAL